MIPEATALSSRETDAERNNENNVGVKPETHTRKVQV